MFKSSGLFVRIMRTILEFGALRVFRAAKLDFTGAASTPVLQRLGMTTVHKLLYDQYKVDNKVVFRNKPRRIPALTVMAARLQDTQPYVRLLEELSKL
jgi:hypothetical protein